MELLSPVKNLESAKVAIASGCDAIYFSSNVFGARESAKNNHEDVVEIVKYAKLNYIKTYVTLNTVVLNDELDLFIAEVNFLHSIGVDAIILQDYSLIEVVKTMFDDLEVHCSTQMNIGNSNAAKFVKNLGASRVVIPRELNINAIKKIVEQQIETEVFVHGALCTSYSGICLISSLESNLSGNRGKCSQFCRMKTNLYKNNNLVDTGEHILSFKDLNASESIDDLNKIGVTSVKVEGRLKQLEYIGVVTSYYRRVIDGLEVDKSDLYKVYNRNFTSGFLNDNNSENINNSDRINNSGYYVGEVIDQNSGWIIIESNTELMHLDKIRLILDDFETGQTIDVIEKIGDKIFKVKTRFNNMIGSSVYVVSSAQVKNDLKQGVYNNKKKKKYQLIVNMEIGKKIEVICNDKKYYSTSVLESALKIPVEKENILKQLNKTKDYAFDFDIELNYQPGFIRISELNELRRNIYNDICESLLNVEHKDVSYKYEYVKSNDCENKIYVEVNNEKQLLELIGKDIVLIVSNDELALSAKKHFNEVYKLFPSVVEENQYTNIDIYDGVIVSEVGGLVQFKDCNKPVIANINTTNIINQQFLLKSCQKVILSVENTYQDLEQFNNASAIGMLYGKVNAMTLKYCPINSKKQNECGNCNLCYNNQYEIEIKEKMYSLMKQNYDKLAVLSSEAVYNKELLNYNISYYIRFTTEDNVKELFDNILDGKNISGIETYLERLK